MTRRAQQVVRRRHGGAADLKRVRQLPLGRQPHVEREPAVVDETTERVGEHKVIGCATPASTGSPSPQHANELAAANGPSHIHSPEIGYMEASDWPSEWH